MLPLLYKQIQMRGPARELRCMKPTACRLVSAPHSFILQLPLLYKQNEGPLPCHAAAACCPGAASMRVSNAPCSAAPHSPCSRAPPAMPPMTATVPPYSLQVVRSPYLWLHCRQLALHQSKKKTPSPSPTHPWQVQAAINMGSVSISPSSCLHSAHPCSACKPLPSDQQLQQQPPEPAQL